MTYDISGKTYKKLYRKYLRSPDYLFDYAGGVLDKNIIDIGAGNMRLSKRANNSAAIEYAL